MSIASRFLLTARRLRARAAIKTSISVYGTCKLEPNGASLKGIPAIWIRSPFRRTARRSPLRHWDDAIRLWGCPIGRADKSSFGTYKRCKLRRLLAGRQAFSQRKRRRNGAPLGCPIREDAEDIEGAWEFCLPRRLFSRWTNASHRELRSYGSAVGCPKGAA